MGCKMGSGQVGDAPLPEGVWSEDVVLFPNKDLQFFPQEHSRGDDVSSFASIKHVVVQSIK